MLNFNLSFINTFQNLSFELVSPLWRCPTPGPSPTYGLKKHLSPCLPHATSLVPPVGRLTQHQEERYIGGASVRTKPAGIPPGHLTFASFKGRKKCSVASLMLMKQFETLNHRVSTSCLEHSIDHCTASRHISWASTL